VTDVLSQVSDIIEPSLSSMGFDLVRVSFQAGTLQVMAERKGSETLSIDDCTEISRTVSALLDVADPIKGRYLLEVSSPGVDRPLVRLSDYERFADKPARIELKLAKDGQKRFKGIVRGANGKNVRLETETGLIELPFADIAQAKLEMADIVFAKGEKKSLKPKRRA
jgi:ribosome maturation factor RimP